MNIVQLKDAVSEVIRRAESDGYKLSDLRVSIQIDDINGGSVFSSTDLELMYDNNCQTSDCVLLGFKEST